MPVDFSTADEVCVTGVGKSLQTFSEKRATSVDSTSSIAFWSIFLSVGSY